MTPAIPEAAQAHLDAANALCPGRYTLAFHEGRQRFEVTDTRRGRRVSVHADPIQACRKALTSARQSVNNASKKASTHVRRIELPDELWTQVQAAGDPDAVVAAALHEHLNRQAVA